MNAYCYLHTLLHAQTNSICFAILHTPRINTSFSLYYYIVIHKKDQINSSTLGPGLVSIDEGRGLYFIDLFIIYLRYLSFYFKKKNTKS